MEVAKMSIDSAIPILIVAICATLLSFRAAKESAYKGRKAVGIFQAALVGFFAWGLLAQGFDNEWPAAVGWVAFLAGAVEALFTGKELAPFEIIPCVSSDPDAGSWPNLFCLSCNIQTKAKRTFPPETASSCPRCGKPLQG